MRYFKILPVNYHTGYFLISKYCQNNLGSITVESPLSAPRFNHAVAQLAYPIKPTETIFPGTNLKMILQYYRTSSLRQVRSPEFRPLPNSIF